MEKPKQIIIVAGETDLSEIPTEILEAMVSGLKESINGVVGQIGEMTEAEEVMATERQRIKEELQSRDPLWKLNHMIAEHCETHRQNFGVRSRPISATMYGGEKYVAIPLPEANSSWTFSAWEWAKTFCEKYKGSYPTHESWHDSHTLYIKARA